VDPARFECKRWNTNRWKSFCFLFLITKERLPLMFSWFFILILLLIPFIFFLFLFLLTLLCFLSPLSLLLCFVFLFPLFLSPSSEDFYSRKDERKTPLVLPCSLRFSLLSFSLFFFHFFAPYCLPLSHFPLIRSVEEAYIHTHTHARSSI